jgi:uncharacterized protein DUF3617
MRLHVAAFALCLLAGCGSQSSNQQAANQQGGNGQAGAQPQAVAAAGSGGFTIQPGEWEITMDMRATQASGMPAGMQMPQIPPSTMRSCVTPEQVARANASFLNGGGHAGMACDYSHVSVTGGRIQGTSTCSRAGMQATVVMDGSFTPTSYDIHQQMQSTMQGRTMASTNHLVGRRIGECTPAQASAAASVAGNGQDGK